MWLEVDDPEGMRDIELGSQGELKQGAAVVALGFPGGAPRPLTLEMD